MKSVKPGRGPSAMGAMGSVIAVVFGIFWTIAAMSMGAPSIFPLFGVLFIIIGIAQAIYNFKNATGKNRFSAFDITDDSEEKDPLQEMIDRAAGRSDEPSADESKDRSNVKFCPYCGAEAQADFQYCGKCGKKLP